MGQAKNRGTLEERVAQSIAAKHKAAAELGLVERTLDDIRDELGIPPSSPFLGFLVHQPDTDEFLVDCSEGADVITRSWSQNPGMAQRFGYYIDAHRMAREGRDIVVGLFESESQYLVAEVV